MEVGDVGDKAVDDTLDRETISIVANSVEGVVRLAACVELHHITTQGILTRSLCEKDASDVFWSRQSDLQIMNILRR